MKKLFFILFVLVLAFSNTSAQEEKSPTFKFLHKRGYIFPDSISDAADTLEKKVKWPDTLYYNTVYKPRLLGSPTIPISFSRVELIDGKYQVSPSISIGYGYAWFWGSFYFSETDKIYVDPTFYFGLIADVALQNDFSLDKLTGVFTGVFIGFGSFSIFGGYDYITQAPLVGLGGRVDLYTVHQNSLKPIGKIREARKHKTGAIPIVNE